jgi:alkylation response protein AidB-like acyl-CoA dehydrogenase
VDFDLRNDQVMLQEQLGNAMSRFSSLSRVRRHVEEEGAFADDVWNSLCDFGVPGLLVPESFGGLGLGILDAALVSEMLGRHTVPAGFLGPVVAAPLAIAAAGSPSQRTDLLPRIATGELRVAIALSEVLAGARAGGGIVASEGRLRGTCHFAIDIAGASMILVGVSGGGLHLVDQGAEGLTVTPLITVDRTRSAAMLHFDNVQSTALPNASAALIRNLAGALQVMLAADLLGAADWMVETAVEYAKVRKQFGRPIGSFQAVKHLCTDMAAELEPGRALMWYAGHAQDASLPDAMLSAFHAKAYLADAARIAARNATEVHGGIGITDELGLHYWFKRITWSGQVLGGSSRMREQAAAEQAIGQGLATRPAEPVLGEV